jgi:hypothetical protein
MRTSFSLLIYYSLPFILILSSCQKVNTAPVSGGHMMPARVKQIDYYEGERHCVSKLFTYDGQDRIASLTENFTGEKDTTIVHWFHYFQGRIETNLCASILENCISTYYLNGKGYADSMGMRVVCNRGDTTPERIIERMEYSAEGYLTKLTTFLLRNDTTPDFIYTYDISEGNISRLTIEEVNFMQNTYIFDYLAGSINTIGNNSIGQEFMGKSNSNLVLLRTQLECNDTIRYNYEFDQQGWVTSQLDLSTGLLLRFTYY